MLEGRGVRRVSPILAIGIGGCHRVPYKGLWVMWYGREDCVQTGDSCLAPALRIVGNQLPQGILQRIMGNVTWQRGWWVTLAVVQRIVGRQGRPEDCG